MTKEEERAHNEAERQRFAAELRTWQQVDVNENTRPRVVSKAKLACMRAFCQAHEAEYAAYQAVWLPAHKAEVAAYQRARRQSRNAVGTLPPT